jgi:hypothetical protein
VQNTRPISGSSEVPSRRQQYRKTTAGRGGAATAKALSRRNRGNRAWYFVTTGLHAAHGACRVPWRHGNVWRGSPVTGVLQRGRARGE